ncbi:MAG: DEAD/DEAH box helicase, partial [Planctomycetaceae bacterium]
MELASVMQKLSFRKNPRDGQKAVLEAVCRGGTSLNVQLPTGYGKTFTACAAYSRLRHQGRVNRLLYITPTTAQHEQFLSGGHEDLRDAGVPAPHKIVDVSFFKTVAIKQHRTNEAQVFAINVQALITKDGMDRVNSLMQQGQWMVVVDEYHHYGLDAMWGKSVLALNSAYRLAMSATPGRKDDDSAFGKPDVIVTYKDAVKEGAVKPLCGHSYTYRVDALTEDGEVVSYTTDELKEEFGEGDQMERKRIERKMRWSPRYISPLVSMPIERMIAQRMQTGYQLQAIVGAMCVSHAQMVCDQVRAMFPELCVEWVGTGMDGRTPEENKQVLQRFCPPKDRDGRRFPFHDNGKLWVRIGEKKAEFVDVLVHVGMAGEGLDSVLVSEVIHLNPANINNSNNQENGRGARYLPGVTGNMNFDSSSEYARRGYTGAAIMDAMDMQDAQPCDECGSLPCVCETREAGERDFDIPEEPLIGVTNMELTRIDSGDPEVQRVQRMR